MIRPAVLLIALSLFTLSAAQELTTLELTVPDEICEQMPRVNSNYVLKLNKSIPEGELSPLLIWMHGGDGSTDTQGQNWPRSQKHFKYISASHPLSVLFPQAVGRGWDGASMEVLIEYVLENYPIDPNRIYLAGGSMGGAGTWLVANHNPDLFAALVPCMGGGLNRKEILGTVDFGRLAALPSWSFCGGIDKVTPIEYPVEIDSILHSLGGDPKLTIYEDLGHGGPAQKAWEDVELYDWLLSRERKQYPFRQENLIAWSIVSFDSLERSSKERIDMLSRLGFEKFAFGGREEKLVTMEEEWLYAKEKGIEISSVWLWLDNASDSPGHLKALNERILKSLKDQQLETQIWVGFDLNYFEGLSEEASFQKFKNTIEYLCIRADSISCKVALYNHGGWSGEPAVQLEIIESLPRHDIGIVYNFHHGHLQMENYPEFISELLPHLWCVSLNGMIEAGPKIVPIGEGEKEKEMIQLLLDLEYQGPYGILGHVRTADVEVILEENVTGLHSLFPESNE